MNPIEYIEGRSASTKSGCWMWLGSLNSYGYGRVSPAVLGERGAHRVSFRAFVGDIPLGMCVLHRCDVRGCVNPKHLFLGTLADNMEDMARKGRGGTAYGERQGSARLTKDQVASIRTKYAAGSTLKKIAAEFGVHLSTIHLVVRRKTWSR